MLMIVLQSQEGQSGADGGGNELKPELENGEKDKTPTHEIEEMVLQPYGG